MKNTTTRREWREQYVNQFLQNIGLQRSLFSAPTLQHLDEWARQENLVMNQPSANWDNTILNLCRAAESELAARLGSISDLGFFRSPKALGKKANLLSRLMLSPSTKQQLNSYGINTGFVSSTLVQTLQKLAVLRREPAHGGMAIRSASQNDAQEARCLVGDIFRGIVVSSGP